MTDLLLIDLSAIAHALWHIHGNDSNPNATSIKVVERVRALASGQAHVAIATDCPPYFRSQIDPQYKANRSQENRAPLYHQIALVLDILRADGFPVWGVKGYEADDIIATAVRNGRFLQHADRIARIVIASADKDLLQLVEDDQTGVTSTVVVKSLTDGSILDADYVRTGRTADGRLKIGVRPDQMLDYLCILGDTSDNVKGIPGLGPVYARALLGEFGTLDAVYAAIDKGATPTITPSQRTKLQEFRAQYPVTKSLIALRTDAPIPFEDIFKPRVAANDVAVFGDEAFADTDVGPSPYTTSQDRTQKGEARSQNEPIGGGKDLFSESDALSDMRGAMQDKPSPAGNRKPSVAEGLAGAAETVGRGIDSFQQREVKPNAAPSQAPPVSQPMPAPTAPAEGREVLPRLPEVAQGRELAVRSPEVVVDYERQLEPRSIEGAFKLAQSMFQARLFSAYGNEHAVLATILAGREFGMPAVASLRAFHIVEGKPTLAADTIRAIVLRSGAAEYFRCTARTAKLATFVTKRRGEPEMSLTFTIEEGRAAWPKDDSAWNKSGWGKNPADMLVARAGAKLARLVYPDVVHGVYAKEEMES